MSRLLKALLCVAVALLLAGAPMAASAAPAREEGALSALEAAWGWVVELWGGVVKAEKDGATIPPVGIVVCSEKSCSPPIGVDEGPANDPWG